MTLFYFIGAAEMEWGWTQKVLGFLCPWENNNRVLDEDIYLKPELLCMSGVRKDGCYGKINLFCAL